MSYTPDSVSSNTARIEELAWKSDKNKLDNAELYGRAVGKKVGDSAKQYYDQAKQSLPEGLSPESFMSKFVRPIIEVITKYIMENYLTEENITTVSNLMQSIVEEFFERLDDIADKNPQVATSVSKLKEMVAKAISKEARRTVVPEGGEERPQAGGKRKRHTKKRRTGKRRY
jgi:hypothetical protein